MSLFNQHASFSVLFSIYDHRSDAIEKLVIIQADKKFFALYGTRNFATAFDRSLYQTLFRNKKTIVHTKILRRYVSILSYHLRLVLPSDYLIKNFPTKILYIFINYCIRATCSANLILLAIITLIIISDKGYESRKSLF